VLKKKIFFPALALAIIGAGLIKTNFVSAQDMTGPNSLITAIAQKFNLNENDVKAVFDSEKSKRQTDMKTRLEQKLTQAVADGKITDAQKEAILNKFQDMQTNKPNPADFKNMTADQRKAAFQQRKTDLENWEKQNGIDPATLQSLIGFHHRGFMMIGK
jgi:tyrosyl-tRNA synthetase